MEAALGTLSLALAVAALRERRSWTASPAVVKVSELILYPIKSCAGTSVEEAVVTDGGFQNDRRWMVVRASDGEMVTQRKTPRMALIQPRLLPHGQGVELRADGIPSFSVPLVPRASDSSNVKTVIIWCEPWTAVDQGDAASAWLTKFLSSSEDECAAVEFRLVYQDDTCRRDITTKWLSEKPISDDVLVSGSVSFADGLPFLIATSESLADLNVRMRRRGAPALPMNRFHPNIVTTGSTEPWAEDKWYDIVIGGVRFFGSSRCDRCILTTTDQATGIQAGLDGEPLETLRTFRGVGKTGKVIFGTNLVPARSEGCSEDSRVVRVGDVLTVNKRVFIGP